MHCLSLLPLLLFDLNQVLFELINGLFSELRIDAQLSVYPLSEVGSTLSQPVIAELLGNGL